MPRTRAYVYTLLASITVPRHEVDAGWTDPATNEIAIVTICASRKVRGIRGGKRTHKANDKSVAKVSKAIRRSQFPHCNTKNGGSMH